MNVGAQSKRRIAVIGSGISGLSAAWLLAPRYNVTVYEAAARAGGHSHTVDAHHAGGTTAVDTGFIVYNVANYPNLVALFDHLGIATIATEMSFAVSLDHGGFEYGSTGLNALLAQRRNLLRPRFVSMLRDVRRFYRDAPADLAAGRLAGLSLGHYLTQQRFGTAFIEDHLLPQAGAIWSASRSRIRDYPAAALVRFFANHQLLQIGGRDRWRTVVGGSRRYVERLTAAVGDGLRLGQAVCAVERHGGGVRVRTAAGGVEHHDGAIIATHADTALGLLAAPSDGERRLLAAFGYAAADAVLHRDARLMPRRRAAWSSWNYIGARAAPDDGRISYWMNRLQPLGDVPPLFLTLGAADIDPAAVVHRQHYTHPLFDTAALAAQTELWRLQGQGGLWFAGAHFGAGFHEDGLQSGLAAAESLSRHFGMPVRRPWQVPNESGRIVLGPA